MYVCFTCVHINVYILYTYVCVLEAYEAALVEICIHIYVAHQGCLKKKKLTETSCMFKTNKTVFPVVFFCSGIIVCFTLNRLKDCYLEIIVYCILLVNTVDVSQLQ